MNSASMFTVANTIVLDYDKQDTIAGETVEAMGAFLDALHDCRKAVLEPMVEVYLDRVIDALLSETILNVDELATHHSVDEIYVNDVTVQTMGTNPSHIESLENSGNCGMGVDSTSGVMMKWKWSNHFHSDVICGTS